MNIECLPLFEVLEDYAKLINKALLIFIPSWENETEEVKSVILGFYRDKVPEEFFNSLVTGKTRIIKYDNFDTALLDATAYFPSVEDVKSIDEKYVILCYIIDENGRTAWSNKYD